MHSLQIVIPAKAGIQTSFTTTLQVIATFICHSREGGNPGTKNTGCPLYSPGFGPECNRRMPVRH